jgi:uncharacterized protein YdaU (DUF1376 family)
VTEEELGQNNVWTAFYWKDYLADTGGLSALEHGMYFQLMANYYASGQPLPSDRKVLRRMCKAINNAEKHALEIILEKFFTIDSLVFRHKRIDEEIAKRIEISRKRSEAVSTRYTSEPTNVPTNVEQVNTHTHTHTQRARRAPKIATTYPEDFQPSDANRALASKMGVNLENALAAFKANHLSKGSAFKDWHQALTTWLLREPSFNRAPAKKQPLPTFDAVKAFRESK